MTSSPNRWPAFRTHSPLALCLAGSALLLSAHAEAQTAADYQTVRVVDTVVNNTDPTLTSSDTFGDWENSLAVNPANPRQIVALGFSGSFGTPEPNAPLWHSLDGGQTWSKLFTIPPPPGLSTFINDQTLDYGRNNALSMSILDGSDNVESVVTTDPANTASFKWFAPGGVTQLTNHNAPGSLNGADQPWVLVNRDATIASQDDTYTAYDDFNNSDGIDGVDMRVAVSYGTNPPNFTVDNQVGNSLGDVNPGLRLAKDPQRGTMYALWQRNLAVVGNAKNIDYMLNRSADGGRTWSLNGNALGAVIANANSTQPTPKFGTVNALLGGVLHAAVDGRTGAVYYAYGSQNAAGTNRIALRRVTVSAAGNATVGAETIVTQREAALPQVAVDDVGTVAVFFYTFDGFGPPPANLPRFTAHLSLSTNQGVSFTDRVLLSFTSPVGDDGDPRQRVLGDFEQTKALGTCFNGVFTANGAALGRPFDNTDIVFYQVCLAQTQCLLASNTIDIRDRTRVTAFVGANRFLELGVQGVITGNPFVNGNAFMRDRSTVTGNLTLGGVLQHQNIFTVGGTLSERATVRLPTLAQHAVAAGSGSQSVPNGATLTPGTYGNVTLEAGATVTFAAGTYAMASLNVQPNATINIPGVVSLNIEGQFTLGDRARINPTTPRTLTVYSNATRMPIGTDTVVDGFLLAPNGTITISSRNFTNGCLGGQNISIDTDSFLSAAGVTLPASAFNP